MQFMNTYPNYSYALTLKRILNKAVDVQCIYRTRFALPAQSGITPQSIPRTQSGNTVLYYTKTASVTRLVS